MSHIGKLSNNYEILYWNGTTFIPSKVSENNVADWANISGFKINPNFGSQDIQSSGGIRVDGYIQANCSNAIDLTSANNNVTIGSVGSILLKNNSVDVLSINSAGAVVQAGYTLLTTSTGNIDLPNNASARFKIDGYAVTANVTGHALNALTTGPLSIADGYHTHTNITASGTAGGDLSGTYPNPDVAKIAGLDVIYGGSPNDGEVLTWSASGSRWTNSAPYGVVPTVTTETSGTDFTLSQNAWQIEIVNVPGSIHTVYLPLTPNPGDIVTVKDGAGDAGTYTLTIDGNGANIDGAVAFQLGNNYDTLTMVFNGTEWFITARYF